MVRLILMLLTAAQLAAPKETPPATPKAGGAAVEPAVPRSQVTGLMEITIRQSGEDKIGQPDPVIIAKLRNISQETLVLGRKAVVFYLAPRTTGDRHIWQGCGDFPADYDAKAPNIELRPGDVVDVVWATARMGCDASSHSDSQGGWGKEILLSWGRLYGDGVVGVDATFQKKGEGESYRATGSKDIKLVMGGALVFLWAALGGFCGWLINYFGQSGPTAETKPASLWDKALSIAGYVISSAVLTLVISEVQIPGIPVKAANDSLLGTFTTGFVFFFASEPVKKWLFSLRQTGRR